MHDSMVEMGQYCDASGFLMYIAVLYSEVNIDVSAHEYIHHCVSVSKAILSVFGSVHAFKI